MSCMLPDKVLQTGHGPLLRHHTLHPAIKPLIGFVEAEPVVDERNGEDNNGTKPGF